MFCTNCGKEGHPVRVACASCGATIEDASPILTPHTIKNRARRSVVCKSCGREATDARIACIHCDNTFPKPFTFWNGHMAEFSDDPDIDRYVITCGDAPCDECRKFDGMELSREQLKDYRLPIETCQKAVCWCRIVGISKEEGKIAFES